MPLHAPVPAATKRLIDIPGLSFGNLGSLNVGRVREARNGARRIPYRICGILACSLSREIRVYLTAFSGRRARDTDCASRKSVCQGV